MAINPVNRGSSPGDGTGDILYDAFGKVNDNEAELDGRVTTAQAKAEDNTDIINKLSDADIFYENDYLTVKINEAIKANGDIASFGTNWKTYIYKLNENDNTFHIKTSVGGSGEAFLGIAFYDALPISGDNTDKLVQGLSNSVLARDVDAIDGIPNNATHVAITVYNDAENYLKTKGDSFVKTLTESLATTENNAQQGITDAATAQAKAEDNTDIINKLSDADIFYENDYLTVKINEAIKANGDIASFGSNWDTYIFKLNENDNTFHIKTSVGGSGEAFLGIAFYDALPISGDNTDKLVQGLSNSVLARDVDAIDGIPNDATYVAITVYNDAENYLKTKGSSYIKELTESLATTKANAQQGISDASVADAKAEDNTVKISKPNEINRKLQTKIYGYSRFQVADETDLIRGQYIDANGDVVISASFIGGNTDYIDITALDEVYYTGSFGTTVPIAIFFDDNEDVVGVYTNTSSQISTDLKISKPAGATQVKFNARAYGYDEGNYFGFQVNKTSETLYRASIIKQLKDLPLSIGFETETLEFIYDLVQYDYIVGDVFHIDSCVKLAKRLDFWDDGLSWCDINFGYKESPNLLVANLFDINEPVGLILGSATVYQEERLNNKKAVRFTTGSRMINYYSQTYDEVSLTRLLCGFGSSQVYSLNELATRYNGVASRGDVDEGKRNVLLSSGSQFITTLTSANIGFINGGIFRETDITAFFNDNRIEELSNTGRDFNHLAVGSYDGIDTEQIFTSVVDVLNDDYDVAKEIVKHLNSYYKAFKDYRTNAPFQMNRSNEVPLTPIAGTMYYLEIYKESDFGGYVDTDGDTYFATWSTDHDPGAGGLYWGTFSNLDMSDFTERGLFFQSIDDGGSQAETPAMVYNPNDPDGKYVYCYFHCYTTRFGIQETRLAKSTGGLLHEADWEQVEPFAMEGDYNGYDAHTGYQRVLRIDENNYVAWGLNKGTSQSEGVFSHSTDGIKFYPFKIIDRCNGIFPKYIAPDTYTFGAPFLPSFITNANRYMFGYAAPQSASSLWDIDSVLGTFIFEMKNLYEVGDNIYKISDTPKGAMLFDDDGYLHSYFYSIKKQAIIHEISDNNIFKEADDGRGLTMPWRQNEELVINDARRKALVNGFTAISGSTYAIDNNDIGNRLVFDASTVTLTVGDVFREIGQRIEVYFKGTTSLQFVEGTYVNFLHNSSKLAEVNGQYSHVILEYQETDTGVQQVALMGDLKSV